MRTLAILILISSQAAFASVWQELEQGHGNLKMGYVRDVKPSGNDILVEIRGEDALGNPAVISGKLCLTTPQNVTEEMRAVHYKIQYDKVNDAKRSKSLVEYGQRGVWGGCLVVL